MTAVLWFSGVAVCTLVVWRLRLAATRLRAILVDLPSATIHDLPITNDLTTAARPPISDGSAAGDVLRIGKRLGRSGEAEPPAIAWPHPPRRLWPVDR